MTPTPPPAEPLFTPPGLITTGITPERIAIIGPPGAGKTTSLLTFPNLIVLDIDKKCPQGIPTIPAWSPEWADEVLGGKKSRTFPDVPNHRDAIKKWLRTNHPLFTPAQTFAIDSWSFLMDACDAQTALEDDAGWADTKGGGHNDFWFWAQKIDFVREIVKYIRSMRCRVVVTFHEAPDRDDKGKINGKVRPVMDGKYKDYILGAFNNVWRMRSNIFARDKSGLIKRDSDGQPVSEPGYFWQLTGDSVVDLNLDPNISRIARKNSLKLIEIKQHPVTGEVTGGYQTIQELFNKEAQSNV